MRWITVGPILLVLALGVASDPGTSSATVPGENGRIVFSRLLGDDLEIFTMNPDGTDAQRLTNSPGEDSMPTWSPDGTMITFASRRDGHAEIYVMNTDGSDQTRVTDTPQPGESWMPAWSPDGERIAFTRSDYQVADIYTVRPDGTNLRNLTSFPEPGHDASFPQWSPDGSRIVYQKTDPPSGTRDICAMNADGSGQTNLTRSLEDELVPSWSPDGATIIFPDQGRFPLHGPTLSAINPDGSGRRTLSTHHVWFAMFSPDGSEILAEGNPLGPAADRIYITDTDGANLVIIGEQWDGLGDWQVAPGTRRQAPTLPPLPRTTSICNAVSEADVTPSPTPPLTQPTPTVTPGALPATGGSDKTNSHGALFPVLAQLAAALVGVVLLCVGAIYYRQ